MQKGDIVLIPFPFTDLSGQKVRPALVLYAEIKGEDCIVAFLSSKVQRKLSFFDLSVKPSRENGLKVSSVLKINKIATLQTSIVIGELGKLEARVLAEVNEKLRSLFKL